MLNLFKAKDITLWFNDTESYHNFEGTVVLDQFVERDIKKMNQVAKVVGGFEDGHVEVTYPVKRGKFGSFKVVVAYYNQFFPTKETRLVV